MAVQTVPTSAEYPSAGVSVSGPLPDAVAVPPPGGAPPVFDDASFASGCVSSVSDDASSGADRTPPTKSRSRSKTGAASRSRAGACSKAGTGTRSKAASASRSRTAGSPDPELFAGDSPTKTIAPLSAPPATVPSATAPASASVTATPASPPAPAPPAVS